MGHSRRERLLQEARGLLASGVTGNVFPGAVAAISMRDASGKLDLIEVSAGNLAAGAKPVTDDTYYDLASLTKPIIAAIALRMVARGTLSLDLRPEQVIADARGSLGGGATLEQLLTHRSGLAAWGGLYLDVPHDVGSNAARRWILAEACRRAEERPQGKSVYSDLGYIVAGETLARSAGRDLDQLLAVEVLAPLGLTDHQIFYPAALAGERVVDVQKRVAPTEKDDWRGRHVRGEVHDENCHALGGVSGHAGLFGTARGVATFGRAYLDAYLGRGEFLPKTLVEHALATRPGGSHRLGWDQKSGPESAAGRRASPMTFGHLGFTGTSIWCDPKRDLVVVLLTNRVCPSRANLKIKGFRPAFYDGIFAAYDQG